jgi:hypothetical protein
MDINRDEVRRQLRESQREHDALLPRFRELLARAFDRERDSGLQADEKARLLGMSDTSRRALMGGGAVMLGGAILAACTEKPEKTQLAQTGTVPATESSSTTVLASKVIDTDLTMLRTAQSIEALAVVAYGLAIDSGKVTTPSIADAARLFQTQHRDHQGALIAQIREIGGEPYSDPDAGQPPAGVSQSEWLQVNHELWDEAVAPIVADANSLTEATIVKLATELENVAAQTYTLSAGVLSTAELRAFMMSIGGIEARHVAVLLGVTDPDDPRAQVPFAFEKTSGAVDPKAYVGPGDTQNVTTTSTSSTSPPGTTSRGTGTSVPPGSAAVSTTVAGAPSTTLDE